jgi:hypothetical protein
VILTLNIFLCVVFGFRFVAARIRITVTVILLLLLLLLLLGFFTMAEQASPVPEELGGSADEEKGVKVRRSRLKTKFSEHIARQFSKLEVSFRPKRIRLYSPPHQRQRWGEAQCLPRVNWGDLFFDLFYVAATYQVSLIIGEDPSLTGILYAAGTFLPVMGM